LLGNLLLRNALLILNIYTNVWVTSFINTGYLSSVQDAKDIITKVSLIGVAIKLICFFFIGVISDKYPAHLTICLSYFVRMTGIILFLFLQKPDYSFYIVYSIIEIG
jgi:hypothetical protein